MKIEGNLLEKYLLIHCVYHELALMMRPYSNIPYGSLKDPQPFGDKPSALKSVCRPSVLNHNSSKSLLGCHMKLYFTSLSVCVVEKLEQNLRIMNHFEICPTWNINEDEASSTLNLFSSNLQ